MCDGCVIILNGNFEFNREMILYRELEKRGKKVDLWFFTHCHTVLIPNRIINNGKKVTSECFATQNAKVM